MLMWIIYMVWFLVGMIIGCIAGVIAMKDSNDEYRVKYEKMLREVRESRSVRAPQYENVTKNGLNKEVKRDDQIWW